MSGNNNSGPPASAGPPDHAGVPDHAGPPDFIRRSRAERTQDGTIEIGDPRLSELKSQIDFSNLSPVEEYLLRMVAEIADEIDGGN